MTQPDSRPSQTSEGSEGRHVRRGLAFCCECGHEWINCTGIHGWFMCPKCFSGNMETVDPAGERFIEVARRYVENGGRAPWVVAAIAKAVAL